MPFFSIVRAPVEVDMELVLTCRDEKTAINLCMDLSGLSIQTIADALGIDKGHMSRIRSRQAHFPDDLRVRLMELCGNVLPLQYEAMRLGRTLEMVSAKRNQRMAQEAVRSAA